MKFLCYIFFLLIAACTQSSNQPSSQRIDIDLPVLTEDERDGVYFKKLNDRVWMHITYTKVEGWGMVRSNGLIILSPTGATLIDTGWNNEQTATILTWSKDTLGAPITSAVFTHAHTDKMGGVQAVRDANIATYAHPKSNIIAPTENLVPAEFNLTILSSGVATLSTERPDTDLFGLNIYYPGAGHTADNIVIGINGTGILFGGCLIRANGSTSLGNTTAASLPTWHTAVDRVSHHFPLATTIIPSHGAPAGRELLTLTAALARKTSTRH